MTGSECIAWVSATGAILSAVFTCGCVWVGRQQNKTSKQAVSSAKESVSIAKESVSIAKESVSIDAQTALLESLLHKRATLEEIVREVTRQMEKVTEVIPLNEFMKLPQTSMEHFAKLEKMKLNQMTTMNAIYSFRHYFDEDELIQLDVYRQRVTKSERFGDLTGIISAKDNCLATFRDMIIPEKLAEIEKQIKNLEAKLKEASK